MMIVKVLVIGGSYFLGRVLTMSLSKTWDMTLVNRGNYSMQAYGVQEYFLDRHNEQAWKNLPAQSYDAVIDLCAYQKGDIETVIKSYSGQIKHYILISTVDVYYRQTGLEKDESHPLEIRHFQGEVGEYIFQKVALEKELQELSQDYAIPYTILRPGNIYGPFNYAPRESLLIQRAVSGQPLFSLKDATHPFQMVYVKDVALAIQQAVEKKAYHQIYNVINNEAVTYEKINEILKQCEPQLKVEEHTIEEAISLQYPLPYPVYKEEMEYYNGQKIIHDLGITYTPLEEGLKKTYQAFYPVYKTK